MKLSMNLVKVRECSNLQGPVSELDPEYVDRSDLALARRAVHGATAIFSSQGSRLCSPLPYLSASLSFLAPSHTHTLPPSSTSPSNSDSFRCTFRDTCDTHHIHSLTFQHHTRQPVFTPKTHSRTHHVLRRRIRRRWRWLLRWRPRRRWWRLRRRVRLFDGSRIQLAELLFQWV
jgi:hypothetical protein